MYQRSLNTPNNVKSTLYHEAKHLIDKMKSDADATIPGIKTHLSIYLDQIQESNYIGTSSGFKTRIKENINKLINERLINNPKLQVEWKKKFKDIGLLL